MDGMDDRRSPPQDPFRSRRALEGDWAAGLPGPAHAHGLPAPEPLGLPPEAEAAPESTAPIAAAEPVAEPAVEAPADWGAAAEPPPEAPAETTPAGAEEEFPVTLSEADEIHEETTAPIDVAPFADSGLDVESIEVEPVDAEAALAQMEAAPSHVEAAPAEGQMEAAETDIQAAPAEPEAAPPDIQAAPAEPEAAPPDIEAVPSQLEPSQAEPAPPDAEAAEVDLPVDIEPIPSEAAPSTTGEAENPSADWLAHPDAAAPADNWDQATFVSEPTTDLEAAFAAVDAPPGAPDLESEAPPALPADDAWGEATAAPASASPDVEPWAVPVDTPWDGSSSVSAAPEIATPSESGELTEEPPEPDWARDRRQMEAPRTGGELTEEPPEPDWSKERRPVETRPAASELTEEPPEPEWAHRPREVFSPLPTGATLTDEVPPEVAGGDRATPPQLELVRGPEMLEDAEDLLVPVEVTPPRGVTAVESAQMLVVPGEQRVAIHTRAGRTRRGTVTDLDLSQPRIALEPQGGGATENIEHSDVKAIFFMLAPGEKAESAGGQAVRVTFADGRTIEGHRQGDESSQGFFLVPLDAQRTNTRRIYVAREAISELVEI
ncbi:MAG: DUF6982 domain-containing protein [Myxococcales bacterium]